MFGLKLRIWCQKGRAANVIKSVKSVAAEIVPVLSLFTIKATIYHVAKKRQRNRYCEPLVFAISRELQLAAEVFFYVTRMLIDIEEHERPAYQHRTDEIQEALSQKSCPFL